jgi:hypothetical protein
LKKRCRSSALKHTTLHIPVITCASSVRICRTLGIKGKSQRNTSVRLSASRPLLDEYAILINRQQLSLAHQIPSPHLLHSKPNLLIAGFKNKKKSSPSNLVLSVSNVCCPAHEPSIVHNGSWNRA